MKVVDGKIVELDPKKWYWFIIKESSPMASPRNLEHLRMENGCIYIVDELDDIEIIENPERIKGVIVKEFDTGDLDSILGLESDK